MTQQQNKLTFRPGDQVQVRTLGEILATLDQDGTLDSLPFMPEMAQYCGLTFPVWKRADKTCIEGSGMRKMDHTVILQGVNCDGLAHGGCQRACSIFWKESWLRPNRGENPKSTGSATDAQVDSNRLPTRKDSRFVCQATELSQASRFLPWWDIRQYARDVTSGNLTLSQEFCALAFLARNQFQKLTRRWRTRNIESPAPCSHGLVLNLQPGELVEIRTKPEILATLDAGGKHKGLLFLPEMYDFCGRRFRVRSRLERMILEGTGTMRTLRNTVLLEGVCCSGLRSRGCPRALHHYWREAWLKRVETANSQ